MSDRPIAAPDLGPLGSSLLSAVDSPGFAPVALVVAFGAGALHACAPGHGKSLTAAYLVGARGRHRDAVLLGGVVAAMHTISVVAVGLGWMALSATSSLDIAGLSQALKLVAALLVAVAGVFLVRRRRASSRHHDHHSHGAAEDARPGLILLGASGGLLPSPAAFLVLLTGVFSGRTSFALVLVLMFGVGMAVVLSVVGMATIGGRDLLARTAPEHALLRRASQVGPAMAAWGVLVAGCALTVVAIAGTPVV